MNTGYTASDGKYYDTSPANVNRSGLAGVEIKERILREMAKNIFTILEQCHVIMDDLLANSTPTGNENVKSIPTGKVPELQEQLRAIERFAGDLNARLQRLTEKI